MNERQKKRLLFIDSHDEWLKFVNKALSEDYDVHTTGIFASLSKMAAGGRSFDLIFIGLNIAEQNMSELSDLAQTSMWSFVVLFPGSPDGKVSRIFFKAGVRDLLSKPYDEETLRKMVEEEIIAVQKYQERTKKTKTQDDYVSQVLNLWNTIDPINSNSL
jgi:DNA-binding NtrC family response regulator